MELKSTTLTQMYRECAHRFADRPAFATRNRAKQYESITFRELYEIGLNLATGLIELGLPLHGHAGLIADNRLEWIIADYGILLAGGADVPRGTDVTDTEIVYILDHSDSTMVFVETAAIADRVKKNKSKLNKIKTIILMDPTEKAPDGTLHMNDLIETGKGLRANGDRRAEERSDAVTPDSLFTLIYTSGTTGTPKGVQLMHSNMVSQVRNVPIDVKETDRILSILPIWHIFERVFEMIAVGKGACTYYTNVRNIKEDLKIVKPTYMASAPRLWESVYSGIIKNVNGAPAIKQKLFHAAYFCSKHYRSAVRFLTGQALDLTGRGAIESALRGTIAAVRAALFFLPNLLLDRIVLSKIREATGGKLKGSISGGGALPIHIDRFFNDIGVPVLEGYGLTETCPVLAVRVLGNVVIGSVGNIWPETEIRIVDLQDGSIRYPPKRGVVGEVHTRGPQVMKGYYKNQEATDAVLKEGWLNTGDIGMITFNDCLKLMGRSKDTIVLLSGENVEPLPIENKLVESPLIDQCIIVGQDQKSLGALIVPALEPFAKYGDTLEKIAVNGDVQRQLHEEAKRIISAENGFKPFERIVEIRLLPKAFVVGEELTAKFSVKRHLVMEKYKKLIESMYS